MRADTRGPLTWPAHMHPGALRFAHASSHYEDTIAFYRDVLGLPVLDEFADSFGEDGTIFGLPDNETELEIVRAQGEAAAGSFDQLVFYLDGPDAVAAVRAHLRDAGRVPDAATHPYWAANGAVSYLDPDGRALVFAPWVFGRDPEPIERPDKGPKQSARPVLVEKYSGDRRAIRALFEEAEDSPRQLDSYLDAGDVLVARRGADVVGHLQVVPTTSADTVEVKNMAVDRRSRGSGIGRSLIETALHLSAEAGARTVLVATATADVGNLRFYQRCGFRFTSVERDAFTAAAGYPGGTEIDDIPLRDRVWLSREV
jgi:predicted N-acetyltransferase YhbS